MSSLNKVEIPDMRSIKSLALPLLFVLAGCSTSSLQTEIIPNAEYDISSYKTYTWAPHSVTLIGVLTGASIVDLSQRIRRYTAIEMEKKGYQFVKSDQPHDLVLSFLVGAVTETQYSAHNFTRERWAYNSTFVWTQANDYLKGALSIIMSDPADPDNIIWQGTAAENLKNNPKRNSGTVGKFTTIIMAHLPRSR